jgi:hypothetical protein
MPMKHRMHGLEKAQVQIASAAALAAVYFGLAPAVAPADPLLPITFLPGGGAMRLLWTVGGLCALSAGCAAIAFSSRKEGALLAVLIGAGGLSLRSPAIRTLLMAAGADTGRLYFSLLAEVLLLWCGLALAVLVIDLAQGAMGRLLPGWAWKGPVPPRGRDPKAAATARAMESITCAALGLIVSVILLRVLLQSSDRGQIIFALAASSAIGVLIAHQVFPARHGIAAWGVPVLTAAAFYLMSAFARVAPTPVGWAGVRLDGMPLPIDWLSAGGGGAVLGYWISCRLHELRALEREEKKIQASEE